MKSFALLSLVFASAQAGGLRHLQDLPDWHVTIKSVSDFSFVFDTGAGGGEDPHVLIKVNDKCHLEAPASQRTHVGDFYPTSNVAGIDADDGGVDRKPGEGDNSIDFKFVDGINGNTAIYTDNMDNTATVQFCVEVGLYERDTMIDFAEIKYSYNVDLRTNVETLIDYQVTHHD